MRGVPRLFSQPTFADPDLDRRGRIAMSVLQALSFAAVLLSAAALFDSRNDPLITLAFYGPMLAASFVGAQLVHRGWVRLVGWSMALLIWVAVSVALLLFGGLQTPTAMPFVIAMTVAGTVVGARAGLWVCGLSIASTTVTLLLQESGRLPAALIPATPANGFLSVTLSLALSAWFLWRSLEGMQRSLDAQRRATEDAKLANARALQAQRLESVGRLAAGVAHDLNNVLGVVQLTADELKHEAKTKPELSPLVRDLTQAADQATLLSRRMVAMSRDQGAPTEALDVGQVVEQFAPLLRRLLPPTMPLRIERRGPLEVVAARAALEHVVLNLVLNARDAMPDGGAIEIVVDAHELLVRDHGTGMTPEVAGKIFQPFFTTRATGTGLGLSNVADLARSMRATVTVDTTPGQGSTFHVSFQRPQSAPVAPPQ